jgi:hypothetical protein
MRNNVRAKQIKRERVMGQILRIAILVSLMVPVCVSQNRDKKTLPLAFELYSWQDTKGNWNFCVLPNTNRLKTVPEVFNKNTALRTIDQLRRKLANLPEGASVFWFDRIGAATGPNAKAGKDLAYPPPSIVETVRKYAEAHKLRLEMLPSQKTGGGN